MDANIIDCELAERDTGLCDCVGGPTLHVLKEVQRAYERQMEVIDKIPPSKRLQAQVELLRSWVGDLVGQNALLARAVEELEAEATAQLARERRNHSEMASELRAELCAARRRLLRKDSDLRGLLEVLRRLREYDNCTLQGIHFYELTEADIFGGADRDKKISTCGGNVSDLKTVNESLYKENIAKEREIRKLSKDAQQYEQTILNLRSELSMMRCHSPDVTKRDAAAMTSVCRTLAECGDWEPVQDRSAAKEDTSAYQERIQKMEPNLEKSGNNVRELRLSNLKLHEEVHSLRGQGAALAHLCHSYEVRDRFKDDVIREMRRQLRHVKDQLTEMPRVAVQTSTPNVSQLNQSSNTQSPDESRISAAQAQCDSARAGPSTELEDSPSKRSQTLKTCRCLEDTFIKECNTECPNTKRDKKSVRISNPEKAVKELFKGNAGTSKERAVKLEPQTLIQEEHDSVCRSSELESPSSSCASSARAQYYHGKLLATLQILKNKEETVRVQAESLAVAEARIVSLTSRSAVLKKEIEQKGRELKTLQETIQQSKVEKPDVSITAKDVDNQNMVTTLQNNLSVIEELYRECFYETAKQEGLIEMLRKSYLDVRLMDKEKSDQISRLNNVINTQKWSLDKFQDIASDVDNLKVEISNFLNNSSIDSGVWEESLAGGMTEDLQDITGQLLRLRELLTGDCICGLKEENRRLWQSNEGLEMQLDVLRQKVVDLQNKTENNNATDKQLQDLIRNKEHELQQMRERVTALEDERRSSETIRYQLQKTLELLGDKDAELARLQTAREQQDRTICQLNEQLHQSRDISKEYCALRGSACAAQRRVAALRTELAKALQNCAHLEECHREEVKSLKAALWEAQSRGASLCEEARRATLGVRVWTKRRRDLQKEQEKQIKQKESRIKLLEKTLERERNNTTLTRDSESKLDIDTCAKCDSGRTRNTQCDCGIGLSSKTFVKASASRDRIRRDEPSCSQAVEGSFTSTSKGRQREESAFETSTSEMGTCSPLPSTSQQQSFVKRFFCQNRFCPSARGASVQIPERCDATTSQCSSDRASERGYHVGHLAVDGPGGLRRSRPRGRAGPLTVPKGDLGSIEDVLSRVESAGAALHDSQKRWNRHASLYRT